MDVLTDAQEGRLGKTREGKADWKKEVFERGYDAVALHLVRSY